MTMKTPVFWNLIPYSLIDMCQRVGGVHFLHLQGRKISRVDFIIYDAISSSDYIVTCQFYQKRRPSLGYGTLNSDAAMEYVKPRNVTNGSTDGNGVLCKSATIVAS
jgi:hypothetical protein